MKLQKNIDSKILAWKIRKDALNMVHLAHASHIASVFSCADIVAVLYADIMNYDIRNPQWDMRDRFVLSKGHSGAALYAALAEVGYFNTDDLQMYGQNGSSFSCHVSHRVPGVEVSTGSLGHGMGIACGMALNAKLRKKEYKTYVVLGDGECNEGIVWEAVMLASQNHLSNFTAIVDYNKMQALGFTKDIICMDSMKDMWKAFGWYVVETDGHSHEKLKAAFLEDNHGKPKVIIAHTIKGKGVSFMENELLWHYRDPQGEYYKKALAELEKIKPCEMM